VAFDELLADRVRDALSMEGDLTERRMVGGVAFMVRGNMVCGVRENDLIVRVGPVRYTHAVMEPDTRPFDMTGRPMTGWVVVQPHGYARDEDLKAWVREALDFVRTLPPK